MTSKHTGTFQIDINGEEDLVDQLKLENLLGLQNRPILFVIETSMKLRWPGWRYDLLALSCKYPTLEIKVKFMPDDDILSIVDVVFKNSQMYETS